MTTNIIQKRRTCMKILLKKLTETKIRFNILHSILRNR